MDPHYALNFREYLFFLWNRDYGLIFGIDYHQNPKAVTAKLQALEQEFEDFREATKGIKWCQKAWWDESNLTLRDWHIADSWFRSRVLQFPILGIGMAPVLDFANHSFEANAYYSVDENSGVVLLPREARAGVLNDGEEITIK